MKAEMTIPIEFEHFLSFLFGKKRFHGHSGHFPFSVWKKDLISIFKTLSRAVSINLDTDPAYAEEIAGWCEHAIADIREAKSVDELNADTIRHLLRIIFMLLGDMPNNWHARQTSHRNVWTLDRFRKIGYLRTIRHRANKLIEMAEGRPRSEKLPTAMHRDSPEGFIEWYRKNRPDLYEKVR
jgi:hypothetical protein